MIIDSIANAKEYTGIIRNLDKALAFINDNYDLPEYVGGVLHPGPDGLYTCDAEI